MGKIALIFISGVVTGALITFLVRPKATSDFVTDADQEMAARPGSQSRGAILKAEAPVSTQTVSDAAKSTNLQKPVSLTDRFKALIEHFDWNEAKRACEELSVEDVRALLAYTASLGKDGNVARMRRELFLRWASVDVEAAWKAALSDPREGTAGYYASAVASVWAETQPEAALAAGMKLGLGSQRQAVLSTVIRKWGGRQPEEAIRYIEGHPDMPLSPYVVTDIINEIVKTDRSRAMKVTLALSNSRMQEHTIRTLTRSWGKEAPQEALAWAMQIENSALQRTAIIEALDGWADHRPRDAMHYAMNLEDSRVRSEALKRTWANWFSRAPNDALLEALKTGDKALMESLEHTIPRMLESATLAERQTLLKTIPDEKLTQEIMCNLAGRMSSNGKYAEAVAILNEVPDSRDRDYQLEQMGRNWGEINPEGAAAWLKAQPPSTDKDITVAGFSLSLSKDRPLTALEWARSIADSELRKAALKTALVRWRAQDESAAVAWINAWQEFSASDREMLINADSDSFFMLPAPKR
jgi:hypothetical protein